jgi:hypothetical protein
MNYLQCPAEDLDRAEISIMKSCRATGKARELWSDAVYYLLGQFAVNDGCSDGDYRSRGYVADNIKKLVGIKPELRGDTLVLHCADVVWANKWKLQIERGAQTPVEIEDLAVSAAA